ncbi:protein lethal(2) giant larvae [Contarinia nasturtii]|uniref:protein lethal(2) giant larvae n=1 Tax=Contarinia nasturtii TaxID=265458 RepID=UPI0012D37B85|nr:protein lethal(2) giant larvae [Contarinia nasturtii]
MWKFIRGKGQQPLAERQKLQKELFAYKKTVQHGFPHKPSAMAYDPLRKLFAIGTHSGAIKVFGRPGVEFYGQHLTQSNTSADCIIQLLEWIPDTGRILSLTTSNQLILWEPAGAMLVPIKSLSFDTKKKISSLCCSLEKDLIWIGTEQGNIYFLNLKTFLIKEPIIFLDNVLDKVPEYTFSSAHNAVESIKQLSNNHNQILIAYNRKLCVLWDLEENTVVRSFIASGHIVGLYVNADSQDFTCYHEDGSYATWSIDDPSAPKDHAFVPYGPDPCKLINKLVKGKRNENDIVIFSGGMPRSLYGDRQCVSIHCADDSKICLDFTSKVIDFFVSFDDECTSQVQALVVLLEEELCAYDLTDPTLKPIKLPYLHSVHTSAVTCNHLVSQVSGQIYQKIAEAGKRNEIEYSELEWPVTGGTLFEKGEDLATKEYEILLTGHEDGSVKFWDCTGVVLVPLLHFKTATLFGNDDDDFEDLHDNQEKLDDSEPPFRKSGLFDPYSDDPRLAVKRIAFCQKSGQLIVAGTAGNIVCANLNCKTQEGPLRVTTMNLVSDRDGFIWKGHDQLKIKPHLLNEPITPIEDGLQVTGILQVLPPAAITCVALQSNWNLVAAGTGHGLVLFDYFNHFPVLHRCTLNPNDLTGAGEALSRRKSFKKTLRESFRRLRKGRSTRNNPGATQTPIAETRPIERQIEARPVDDAMNSLVRCLTFSQTFIANIHTTTPTLWSATNSSCVSVFVLNIPPKSVNDIPSEQRKMITAQLAKSIQLKHRAPVVNISIFDNSGVPLELSHGPGTAPHRVLIASEEQFKVFSLPQLKPVTKYKLTAHEGARVRKMAFATFSCIVPPNLIHSHSPTKTPSKGDSTNDHNIISDNTHNTSIDANVAMHTEVGLLCLTNLGDCLVLSIPELKRQINAAAVRREDISGITSLCFTNYGEALYMMSSSELQRISLSATKSVRAEGVIEVEPHDSILNEDEDDDDDEDDDRKSETKSISTIGTKDEQTKLGEYLTNGVDVSPANVTITSSIGDITVDSVRDHLNSTVTTLHATTTEEIVGRLSVLSTQANNTLSSIQMKDVPDINISNLKDLAPIGETTETSSNTIVIKSIITTISNGQENGETEKITTTTTTRKESQL